MPTGVWVNVAIVSTAAVMIVILAALHDRLPRISSASAVISKVVLAITRTIAVTTSAVVPLVAESMIGSAGFEHVSLALSAVATVAVAAASWLSR